MDTSVIQNYLWVFLILAIWEFVWKGLGLWRAAQNSSKPWFIAILIINTAGILPIIYLLTHKKGGGRNEK